MTRLGLTKLAGGICLAFVALASAWSQTHPYHNIHRRALVAYVKQGPAAGERFLHGYLIQHPEDRKAWLMLVRHRQRPAAKGQQTATFLSEKDFQLFLDTSREPPPHILRAWYAFYRHGLVAGLSELGTKRTAEHSVAAARMLEAGGSLKGALGAARAALREHPQHIGAARALLDMLVARKSYLEARRLLDNPIVLRASTNQQQFRIYRGIRDYPPMLVALLRMEIELAMGWTMLAGLTVGLAWVLLCLQLGWSWTWPRGGYRLAAAAFLLGILSTLATVCVVVLQDEWLGKLTPKSTFQFTLIYCVFGIGLREELIKLLFLLPLIPFLRRSRSDVQILSICSLAGLGFAVFENVSYYHRASGAAVLGRFLTANFLHMVLTGYTGYYLIKAIQLGGEKWLWFSSQATQMVVIHGLYDFFQIDPRVAEYGAFISAMLFIWLSQIYLRLIIELAPDGTRPIPLTRLFVASIALALGVGYLLAVSDYGLWQGAQLTLNSSLGVAVITFMFFREFDERVD